MQLESAIAVLLGRCRWVLYVYLLIFFNAIVFSANVCLIVLLILSLCLQLAVTCVKLFADPLILLVVDASS